MIAVKARTRTKSRANPPAMSKERVVDAALALIDAQGVDGFSMRGLAEALGVYPTAIYWYVENRNALLAAVVGHALRDVAPEWRGDDWQAWLKNLFRRYRAAVQRHPNIAPLIGAQLVSNAGVGAAFIDRILTVLASAGFTGDHLVHAYNAVIAVQVGFVTLEFAPAPKEDRESWADDVRAHLRGADAAAHPVLAQNLGRLENRAFIARWQNGADVPLDDSFELFIDIAVAGLAQRVKPR
jgi:TetR/AcrR family transcriptional regulator, tetracycline repressor protein